MNVADHHDPLNFYVERAVRKYFDELEGSMPTDLYAIVLNEIEKPLLKVLLEKTKGNQSKCASILGINRGTLRKKLKIHGLL